MKRRRVDDNGILISGDHRHYPISHRYLGTGPTILGAKFFTPPTIICLLEVMFRTFIAYYLIPYGPKFENEIVSERDEESWKLSHLNRLKMKCGRKLLTFLYYAPQFVTEKNNDSHLNSIEIYI